MALLKAGFCCMTANDLETPRTSNPKGLIEVASDQYYWNYTKKSATCTLFKELLKKRIFNSYINFNFLFKIY